MQIKYKIVEIHPDEQQIVVRFYSDSVPEASLASQVDASGTMLRCRTDVAITLPQPTPTGMELETLILYHCPIQFFKTVEAVRDPSVDTSLSALTSLKGVEVTKDFGDRIGAYTDVIAPVASASAVPIEVV